MNKSRSIMNNIKFVLENMRQREPQLLRDTVILFLPRVILPVLAIVLPKILIDVILYRRSLDIVVLIVAVYTTLLVTLTYIDKYITSKTTYTAISNRTNFITAIGIKTLAIFFENLEMKESQKLHEKALRANDNNDSGTEAIVRTISSVFVSIVSLIISLIVVILKLPVICIIAVVTALFMYMITNKAISFEAQCKSEWALQDRQLRTLLASISETRQAKDIRVFNMKDWLMESFENTLDKRIRWKIKTETRLLHAKMISTLLSVIRDFTCYGYLIYFAYIQVISVGDLVLYAGFLGAITSSLQEFLLSLSTLRRNCNEVDDVRDYLEIDDDTNSQELVLNTDIPQEFTIKNLSYCYQGSTKPAVNIRDLYVMPREKIAIVGKNGSGKSTFIKLLSGLYKPTEGIILYGKQNINILNRKAYYDLISAVYQEVNILPTTIGRNISPDMDKPYDKDCIERAMNIAGIDPKNYPLDQLLVPEANENAISLSGGELQKLLIARAIYKNTPVLFLDEPTASLDALSEMNIYESYSNLVDQKTAFFISHRLASTLFCDRILYFDEGSILEQGTHADLMKLDGEYAKLFKLQSNYYVDGDNHDEN